MIDQAKGQLFLEELPEIRQELPFSPALLGELFYMTGENSLAPLEQIAQTVNQDQGLSTKVLSLANSAFYGLQARVTSVARAIALLGLKEIRNLVLILGTQALTVRHNYPRALDLRAYWDHQFRTGICAKFLAERLESMDPDILFTCGLLHDLGMLLTALYRPLDWSTIHADVMGNHCSWSLAEERHWGLEHGLIGAMTLNSWNLPPEITEPINWHHAPHLAEEHRTEACVVCAADSLHHHLRDENYPLPESAVQSLEELSLDEQELLAELSWVLEEESISQFVAHLA